MAVNRYYSNTAVSTTLSSGINNSVTSMQVGSVSGFPVSYPYTLVIDRGTPSEELVTVTAAAGTTLTVTRGADGTTAVTHSSGAAVEHSVSARDFREPQEHIDATAAHGATGQVVGTTNTQTLTNKTISLGSNTVSGTTAQFNAALSDNDFVTLAGPETLTSKVINLGNNTLAGTTAQFNNALSDGDFATLAGTATLTNKTINLTSNTLTGTRAQWYGAMSDDDFATCNGTEALTNKTLSSPVLSGTMSGSGSINISGTVTSTGNITSGGAVAAVASGGFEIIMGYAGTRGLSIANAGPGVATHPNGMVLWTNGTNLFVRKPGGGDVTIA